MNTKQDNVKIEINIAGEFIKLAVPIEKQESVRDCESAINSLFSEWRRKFPKKSNSEIMAMIAYQYASYYQELSERYDSLAASIEDASQRLDNLLE